jgi:fumarylpyruvate hydrolase
MKIICVGMNYSKHNKELGETLLKPDSPVIFMKPDSSILRNRRPFFLPDNLGRIDYETEVVVRISRLGKSIAAKFADRYWDAVTLGIDFTARDMQTDFRSKGLPWELCKGFDGSAVIGDWIPREEAGDIENLRFNLDIDGKTDFSYISFHHIYINLKISIYCIIGPILPIFPLRPSPPHSVRVSPRWL